MNGSPDCLLNGVFESFDVTTPEFLGVFVLFVVPPSNREPLLVIPHDPRQHVTLNPRGLLDYRWVAGERIP